MKKKKYSYPEIEIVSLSLIDVLTASEYSAVPENPVRSGVEGDDLFG